MAAGTQPLLLREAHDLHGLQSLIKQLVILLTGDLHMSRHQETIAAVVLQKQLLYGDTQ